MGWVGDKAESLGTRWRCKHVSDRPSPYLPTRRLQWVQEATPGSPFTHKNLPAPQKYLPTNKYVRFLCDIKNHPKISPNNCKIDEFPWEWISLLSTLEGKKIQAPLSKWDSKVKNPQILLSPGKRVGPDFSIVTCGIPHWGVAYHPSVHDHMSQRDRVQEATQGNPQIDRQKCISVPESNVAPWIDFRPRFPQNVSVEGKYGKTSDKACPAVK